MAFQNATSFWCFVKRPPSRRPLLRQSAALFGASTPLEDARCIVENFSIVKPTALYFTKLDETRRFGHFYSLALECGLPLSYFSTGQNVPDDLLLAQPATVAQLLSGGAAANLAGK